MKNVNGEVIVIEQGSVNELTYWLEREALPLTLTLTRGDFSVSLRTNHQRELFIDGMKLGAILTSACAITPSIN